MSTPRHSPEQSPLGRFIGWTLDNKLVVFLLLGLAAGYGAVVAPFDWDLGGLPRDPVPVDAIPDLGENQQIVFAEWPGRSPRDVEDQVTYPLTVALLGVPDVKAVRSYSFFGFASVYVIFEDRADFYDSRSRLLEKLSSLPPGSLPTEVSPRLGPDATALGQIFWYTLQGRDAEGQPAGGWDLDELRTVQDWYVKDALLAADGVAEVASVGGFVREYQVDVDPDALLAFDIGLDELFRALQQANLDVGARTIEFNQVEYVVRGIGFIESLEDIGGSVVAVRNDVPVTVDDVALVSSGPAMRRGLLDVVGAEAVGGVVVARYGENPLAVIDGVKQRIEEISAGLPSKQLPDGRISQLTIVPFYDRSFLIHETLGTLGHALSLEILITIIVVFFMVRNLRSGFLVAGLLPLAVLFCFVAMKLAGVEANVVALSGIAIAIGTMVDMGVILTENIVRRLEEAGPTADRREVIQRAASEVGGAVLTAVTTTVLSFLPVFTLIAAEGKLFRPLAFTKTFALLAALILAVAVIPPMALLLWQRRTTGDGWWRRLTAVWPKTWSIDRTARLWKQWAGPGRGVLLIVITVAAALLLAWFWMPLGPARGLLLNGLFVLLLVGGVLFGSWMFQRAYADILRWCLDHKLLFLGLPGLVLVLALTIWLGFDRVFAFLPGAGRDAAGQAGDGSTWSRLWSGPRHTFPGLGQEFMPPLDEGSYLYMPTTMPHASIGEAHDVLSKLDRAISTIPEVYQVVGKLGRVESALDPAPISMVETVINYLPEYRLDERGRRIRFKYDRGQGEFKRDEHGELIPDRRGRPYRQWRAEIRTADDIWQEIVRVARLPGTTSAPKLQPISTRLVMLQSGMRAPMGIKVKGPSLEAIELTGLAIEALLKEVPGVNPATVFADRIVGKPYLEIEIDRDAIARHGLTVGQVQAVIEMAVGGRVATTTVEGRQRYAVRVRYARERRDSLEELAGIRVPTPGGAQIPLLQLAEINYRQGPQAIKSEDTFLVGYVIFDKASGQAEVDVVEKSRAYLAAKLASGELELPAGVSYRFAGSFENQQRAARTLQVVLPVTLALIFLVLYLQFRSVLTTAMIFGGVFVAWSGGFLLIWLYGQSWFLDLPWFGAGLRDLFQIGPVNLSVAVWVGFIALFGIATDDGVLMATYLDQTFGRRRPRERTAIREATVAAATRRVRPALMTSVTTILALLPVLSLTGRGADIMIPMAIPSFGGMVMALLTLFIVPTLYCARQERLVDADHQSPE
ncbi:MAG: efflux RND transporter permease subunit [bacterium]